MTSTKFKPAFEILLSVLAFTVAYMTMQGTLQKHIYFADPLNEMAFCVMAIMIGFLYMYLGIANTVEAFKKK